MKAKVEWKDGEVWRQVDVQVAVSRNNNLWFKHAGAVYVFPSLKLGVEVVSKNSEGKWLKVGRVARDCVFLGEGMSWSETNEAKFKNETKLVQLVIP
jgi:hypothetical protein